MLADAAARGTPVVTRGAGTGLAGGAVATEGCIVLDVSGMDAIRRDLGRRTRWPTSSRA